MSKTMPVPEAMDIDQGAGPSGSGAANATTRADRKKNLPWFVNLIKKIILILNLIGTN